MGIPVCIGIAPSKTLAKLANHVAKKQPHYAGVCDFNALSPHELDVLFAQIEVGAVWGVGRHTTAKQGHHFGAGFETHNRSQELIPRGWFG